MKVSDFDVFKVMSERNKNIKVYPFSSNLKSANAGSKGWGSVTVAVDTPTTQQIMAGRSVAGMVLVIDIEDFMAIKEELSKSEGENGPNPDP